MGINLLYNIKACFSEMIGSVFKESLATYEKRNKIPVPLDTAMVINMFWVYEGVDMEQPTSNLSKVRSFQA